jgi:hypothetical protein
MGITAAEFFPQTHPLDQPLSLSLAQWLFAVTIRILEQEVDLPSLVFLSDSTAHKSLSHFPYK